MNGLCPGVETPGYSHQVPSGLPHRVQRDFSVVPQAMGLFDTPDSFSFHPRCPAFPLVGKAQPSEGERDGVRGANKI
jgi:hypothetical protein